MEYLNFFGVFERDNRMIYHQSRTYYHTFRLFNVNTELITLEHVNLRL